MSVFCRNYASVYFCIILLTCSSLCLANRPNPFSKENKCLVNKPVLTLYEKPSKNSKYDSQEVYGRPAYIVEKVDDQWALVETEDNYRGYALLRELTPDNPRWRTSKRLCRVSSLAGMVQPVSDDDNPKEYKIMESPPLTKLPFGSLVEAVKSLDENEKIGNHWIKIQLLCGKYGWMLRGDLEKPRTRSLEEMMQLSHKFLGRPYIWGGNSSEGYDCSGYVQTLCKLIGVMLPRNSRPQADSEKLDEIERPEKPGDLVFFGTHRHQKNLTPWVLSR